jgi:DNA-binding XRE family transcriptional regulator
MRPRSEGRSNACNPSLALAFRLADLFELPIKQVFVRGDLANH